MLIILLLFLCCFSPAVAETNSIDHWETVVYAHDTWKFFIGDSEPHATWTDLSFDDTAWPQGPGGIGYGDDDDLTQIDRCLSVYIRIKFTIFEPDLIEAAILHVDYDDAFIAYINNTEVARAGISGIRPPYNQTADSNHEAQLPAGNPPSGFTLPQDQVKTILQQGENVLALQVHNVNINSSDLSSTTFLSVGVTDTSRQYRKTPPWFVEPFTFSSSDIPIVIIDTEGGTIVHEPKIMARMGIINKGAGNRNSIDDPFNEYDGWIGIEYRGNASFRISDKKPFTIETRHEDGSNNNVEILGLPEENDFVLRAAYMDKTLMRDALAYYMYRSMGRWAPRTRHVELVLNGSYQGVYILEEKIKPDKNRLDIARLDSSDISGEALTGGYIWCTNRRWGDEEHNDLLFDENEADGNPRFLRYPKPNDAMPEQLAYISHLEQEFCDVMAGPNYKEIAVLVNQHMHTGEYVVDFKASNLPSGIYVYRIQAGDFSQTKKMILLR